ncbi:serine/threonine-protein kinase [Kitasatospora sp. NPDC059811]|uniref:serine/threonine-protein kinase n=1 Tax=Streptomycetaceae TaxID=2062 RepID=UPI000AC1A201|nr:serine/threonine-protein kinase [Streptomyces sp. MJM8645]
MTGTVLPQRIGPYAVERCLGTGGMGAVYLAYSVAGDPVAVKVIRPDKIDPHSRARFEREAEIARTISGTGRVARFLDADPLAEQPWLAMDYVPGRPLTEVVKDQGPLPAPLVASVGALLAEGLAAVHGAGLLHRDLKASNVILGDFGPVIIDFGLGAFLEASKGSMSQPGTVLGTVRCMPPEQARGETEVTGAADVYGLGTVLLHAATGHAPYDGVRWEAIAVQVVSPDVGPDLSGLPEQLTPLLTSMLAYEPGDRPTLDQVTRHCADLLRELGTSPARARHALIQQTRPADGAPVALPQPDALMLDRLEALDKLLREQPEAVPGAEADSAPAEEGSPAAGDLPVGLTPAPAGPPTEPRPPAARPGRPPASRRVADELRKRYAARGQLTWSERQKL